MFTRFKGQNPKADMLWPDLPIIGGGGATMVNHWGECLNWVEFQVLNKDQTCGLKDYRLNKGRGSWVKSITEEVKDNWSVV